MISRILATIFGTNNDRQLKKIWPIVTRINSLEPEVSQLTDEQLAAKTNEFREQYQQGKSLDDLLPEAFAVVREVSKRTLGQRHYDVQLIGGIVLHQGKISEMKTGEGKTLSATLPLYLNAIAGKGAHLVTVNDYLARRDSEWMSPIYNGLGLEVACLQNSMTDQERKDAYNADILYATNNELGFDYLRDNMKFRNGDCVQRELHYAIVDEVDSILIDEARTPLIISGSADESSRLYVDVNKVVARFVRNTDYEVDEKARSSQMTEAGIDKIEHAFGVENLYAVENINILHHAKQALRANAIFKRDVDYVVKDDQVLIVDEFTGRILPGRRYSDGLHQALEAKEGVTIERESHTLASITLQNFFRMYKKLAGMTGTAATEAEEFHNIYKLSCIVVPTNRPLIRKDQADLIFLTEKAKFEAIVKDIKERYIKKQPVLIGTVAIEKSELLSRVLTANGVPHEVLNAKQHEREAEIVEHAGQPGHITIATNMAGRGTDIKLSEESLSAGGLYVLGTERHESRRIDNQLRGRSGRQGDPGESRFYISLEDDLIRRFAGDTLKSNMQRFGMQDDEVIESRFVSKTIERAQEKVEKQNFEIRKHLIEYDDVLNQQRKVVYSYRKDILEGEDSTYELIRDFIAQTMQNVVAFICHDKRVLTASMVNDMYVALHHITGIHEEDFRKAGLNESSRESFESDAINFLLKKYELYRSSYDPEMIKESEKWLMLETIDQAWKQHMVNLDRLKEGIGLRGWGQKNPLIEYKREAFGMFKEMMGAIVRDIVRHLFRLNAEHFNAHEIEKKREKELEQINMVSSAQSEEPEVRTVTREEPKTGRNEACTCGSGKKYKKCCG